MASKNVEYKIVCNTDGTVSAIEKVVAETKKLKEEAQEASDSVNDLEKNGTDLEKKLIGLGKQIGMTDTQLSKIANVTSVATKMFTKLAPTIATAGAAYYVCKQKVEASQEAMDDFNKMAESSESVIKSFWASMNTGSPTTFLQNIKSVTDAAANAYDSLKRLQLVDIFADPDIARLKYLIEQQSMILDDKTKTAEERQTASTNIETYTKELEGVYKKKMDAYKAVSDALITKAAAEQGIILTEQEKEDYFGSLDNYDKKLAEGAKLVKERNTQRTQSTIYGGGIASGGFSMQADNVSDTRAWKLYQMLKDINREDLEKATRYRGQYYSMLEEKTAFEHEKQNERQGLNDELKNENKTGGNKTELRDLFKDLNTDPITYLHKLSDAIRNLKLQKVDVKDKLSKTTNPKDKAKLEEQLTNIDKEINQYEGRIDKIKNTLSKSMKINKNFGIELPIKLSLDKRKTRAQLEAELKELDVKADWEAKHGTPEGYKAVDKLRNSKKEEIANWENTGSSLYEEYAKSVPKSEDMFKAQNESAIEFGRIMDSLIEKQNKLNEAREQTNRQKLKVSDGFGQAEDALNNLATGFAALGESSEGMQKFSKSLALAATIAGFVSQLAKCTTPWEYIAASIAGFAAIATSFASLANFANGGIIEGPTSMGDYNIARVNSGEMILNTSQQGRLFNMLNGVGALRGSQVAPAEREWRIEGATLVGVIKNYNAMQSKLGKKIF